MDTTNQPQLSEYAATIVQQVRDGYHTVADVAEMKRCHESLYGTTPDDPSYVSVCEALKHLLTPEQTMIRERDREGQPPAPESEGK